MYHFSSARGGGIQPGSAGSRGRPSRRMREAAAIASPPSLKSPMYCAWMRSTDVSF